MNPVQGVFMLFFAIFWGAIANVQPRWKQFQWPLVWRGLKFVNHRVLLSVVLLNIVPMLFFGYVMHQLSFCPVEKKTDATPSIGAAAAIVLCGVLPAFAVFGFYRMWLGIVELCPKCFYSPWPANEQALPQKHWHVEPTFRLPHETINPSNNSNERERPVVELGDCVSGWLNLVWGIVYFIIGAVAPLICKCVCL